MIKILHFQCTENNDKLYGSTRNIWPYNNNKRKTVQRHFTKRLTGLSVSPVKNVYNELTCYTESAVSLQPFSCFVAMALCHLAAEYCAPVWSRSAHLWYTLRSTPLPWLPVFSSIDQPATGKMVEKNRQT